MILLATRMIFVPKDQSKIDKLAFWTLTMSKKKCKEAIDGRRVIKERLSAPSGNIPYPHMLIIEDLIHLTHKRIFLELKHLK
jgi:hypothetical protein